jgi:hypothetical protein
MQTLLLNPDSWGDLMIDANGNIAVADSPYSLAQDVCCAIRTFTGDLWYYQQIGIPYYGVIFGEKPNLTIVRDYLEKAALSVSGVVKAKANIISFENREITGQVIITDSKGIQHGVNF